MRSLFGRILSRWPVGFVSGSLVERCLSHGFFKLHNISQQISFQEWMDTCIRCCTSAVKVPFIDRSCLHRPTNVWIARGDETIFSTLFMPKSGLIAVRNSGSRTTSLDVLFLHVNPHATLRRN